MRVLTGIQPSGTLHWGNYFGAMKSMFDLQAKGEDMFMFIANFHAMTTVRDGATLRKATRDVALDYLACGLDPAKTTVYRQSDVPEVQELAWYLSCLTPMGLLERCHSYKDKMAHGFEATHGLFAYPVLMAADILIMNSDLVPVGKDQKQHLEVTRDLAQKFNNAYGEIFKLPDAYIPETVATIPGTDGQKMSKSYHNTIELFDPSVKKKVMAIVTDSKTMEEPKEPEGNSIYELYKLFAILRRSPRWRRVSARATTAMATPRRRFLRRTTGCSIRSRQGVTSLRRIPTRSRTSCAKARRRRARRPRR